MAAKIWEARWAHTACEVNGMGMESQQTLTKDDYFLMYFFPGVTWYSGQLDLYGHYDYPASTLGCFVLPG